MRSLSAETRFLPRVTAERVFLLFLAVWVIFVVGFWTTGTTNQMFSPALPNNNKAVEAKKTSDLEGKKASVPQPKVTKVEGGLIMLQGEQSAADKQGEVFAKRELGYPDPSQMPNPAIVVLTYNRADYLERTLESLAAVPGFDGYKLYVSQDGQDRKIADMVKQVKGNGVPDVVHLVHPRPSLGRSAPKTEYVASHYGFALKEVFETMNHSHAIVVEDDMLFSSDFLELFVVTARLLNEDDSVWCVSSWNDYGLNFLHLKSNRFYRTSRFPGLGWMITQKVWMEMSSKWPSDAWDYFMQTDVIRKGRDCIAPELSRNHNIGQKGTTMKGTFYSDHLAKNSWNEGAPVIFGDLQYLSEHEFVRERRSLVEQASVVGRWPEHELELMRNWNSNRKGVWLLTVDRRNYQSLAKKLHLLDSWRAGHAGLIVLRKAADSIFLIADERVCEYLPKSLRKLPAPGFTINPGELGQSCTATCAATSKICDDAHFQYVNKCSALAAHFPCEEGCQGGVVGTDIPNYQDSTKKKDYYHRCLTTESIPQCNAQHFSGRRLCPCIQG